MLYLMQPLAPGAVRFRAAEPMAARSTPSLEPGTSEPRA